MYRVLVIVICLFLVIQNKSVLGQKSSYRINTAITLIDANDPIYQSVKPGDTLLFVAGNRDHLLIKNFVGKQGKPIVMMNTEGVIIIDTQNYYGIAIQNCRYIKFTGSGDPTQKYGFQIKRVGNGAGMGIGELSSDFEIDHVSIENTLIGALYAKTDPDCTLLSVRGKFTQYNTNIHDNFISNSGNEGIYVGSSFYDGQAIQCNAQNLLLLPGLLDGVKIYNNIVTNSGWDAIQVSCATKNCEIYNNTIQFDSQAEIPNQMSGILIGGGTRCDCYNNFISQGKGCGIECHGLGGCRIFNNIIVDAGLNFAPNDLTQMKHGIFISDLTNLSDSTLVIKYNDIINPKSDGIRFSSLKSTNNLVASNVIINPGNFDYYQNGNTSFKGVDSYIMVPNSVTEVVVQNNYLARNSNLAGFSSQNMDSANDFIPVISSPLIDQAETDKTIPFDFEGNPRPFGPKPDIGAFEVEYDIAASAPLESRIDYNQFKLLKNPVTDLLIISIPRPSNSPIFVNIYNLIGEMIFQSKQHQLPSASPTVQVDLSAIPPGTYIYTVRTDQDAGSGKFIKR
ncbi:MAG: right-handed parallel beta-helix repeat-containing protein [Mariniphaga sp.]